MNLIKKTFLILFFAFAICFCGLQSFANVKINNINFDNSSGFMFLSTSTYTTENSEPSEITSTTLKNPDRIFFDISNAILTRPNETWYFRNSDISQIKVSQFSTSPNIVRVVFYHSANFNPKQINVLNIKGNYLFKYGDIKLQQNDFYTSYRFEHNDGSDFIVKSVYIPASEVGKVAVNPQLASINAQNIQKAFASSSTASNSTQSQSQISAQPAISNGVPNSFDWSKVFKLRTTYFLSRVDVKRGNVLILGSGRARIEKPIYLSNPTRVVFDMPNTVVAQKFKNVEIQLSETETLKVGQFEPSKVRLVITTTTPDKYRPIFSSDGQGLLIGHDNRMAGIKLYDKGAQTLKTTVTAQDVLTNTFKLEYAFPVVYSVKETDNKFELMVYNATGFNDEIFQAAIKNSKLSHTEGSKMNIGGVKYVFNLQQNSGVDVQSREDGKQLKIVIKNNKASIANKSQPIMKNDDRSDYKGCGLIIIDPGHGGVDSGAIRADINEKDITLEVSKMVAAILTKKGYKVDLTRWEDKTLSLQDRVDIADSRLASVFVSIHVNSSVNEEPNGIETHWWTDEGQELAKVVHTAFAKNVQAVDRGLVKSKFYVINHTKAKSILVEIGFISNDNERKELLTKERQQKTADGIAEGIIKFMKKEGIK